VNADDPALVWAATRLGIDALVDRGRLPGGSASTVRLLEHGDGRWVLKTVAPGRDAGDPALIGREASVLEALEPLGLPVPRVLAVDARGAETDGPALLMSWLPGCLPQGADAVRASIPALVEVLVELQRRTRALIAGRRWHPWFEPDRPPRAEDREREAPWGRAAEIVRRFPTPGADGFIHRDPHPANLLLDDGAVTGVLDWANAGRGPRGVDLARLCLNLACLCDVDAASAAREHWQSLTGARHDPLLDVYALLESDLAASGGHPTRDALGIHLDAATLGDRLDAFLVDTLRRMTVRRAD
jgi:aminoglycoside phosphotransferase (APT) family kinase protein